MKTKDGGWKWILASGKLMERTADGKPQRMVGIHQDIDDQKRNADRLHEANQKFQVAMQGAELGLWDWNMVTNEVGYSDRWMTMLGYTPTDLAPNFDTFVSLVHPEDGPRAVDLVNKHVAGEIPNYDIEFRMKTKDGGWKWILASGKLMERTADGKPQRMIGIHQDIDARKHAELDRERLIRQLREASRYKDEFFAVMSHELRTPLNAMIGLLGIVLMKNKLAADDANMVTRARANSDRLLTLINNILDISRMEAGRLQLTPINLNMRKLMEKLQASMGVLADQKNLDFKVIVDTALPETILLDDDAITKIVTNLLSNAIKFTEKGSVELKVEPQDDNFILTVTDSGIGIPAHMHEIIFETFRQVDASSTRAHGGSGLGLSIVRNLCQAMQGTVRLESEPGKGSTFTVTLPMQVT
jgi:PAS domain S-box-containing protein